MSNKFEPLQSGEVIAFNFDGDDDESIQYDGIFKMPPTFKKSELEENIKDLLIGLNRYCIDASTKLFNEGLGCEALKFQSQNWRKGKIRVRIEVDFCPDESEALISDSEPETSQNSNSHSLDSSLDDIRSILNEG